MESSTGPYKLEVRIEAPEEVDEWTILRGTIIYKNISRVPFPGINTGYHVKWAEIADALDVYDPTNIGPLGVAAEQRFDMVHRTPASGLTQFTVETQYNTALDGLSVEYYLEDGRLLSRGQLVFALRVRSQMEILTSELINALGKSSNTQDRLAKAEVFLGAVAAIFTLVQIYLSLFVP